MVLHVQSMSPFLMHKMFMYFTVHMNQPAQWRIWTEPLSCKITRFYNNEMQSATGTLPSVVVGLRKKKGKENRTEVE